MAALELNEGGAERSCLAEAVAACRMTDGPSRELDALIALAMFGALRTLARLAPGVWQQSDGSRVRALLYSASYRAAATLVPSGCWIERDARGTVVAGERGEWVSAHPADQIALCIAALEARLGEISHEP